MCVASFFQNIQSLSKKEDEIFELLTFLSIVPVEWYGKQASSP
jgi:hypothetical protein